MTETPASTTADGQHLQLLSIFHYVVAGLTALFGCFPIIHVTVGMFFLLSPQTLKDSKGNVPEAIFGLLFVLVGGVIIVMFWTFAVCLVAAGRCLALRRHYMFCLVMAAITCMCQPWGTVLGVFTIIVLMRESVKQLFAADTAVGPATTASGGLIV